MNSLHFHSPQKSSSHGQSCRILQVIYRGRMNYPKLSSVKQHTFIMSQFLWTRSPHGAYLFLWLWVSHRLQSSEISPEVSTSKLTQVAVGRTQLLTSCWRETFLSVPFHADLSMEHLTTLMVACFISCPQEREQERVSKTGSHSLLNLIMKEVSHHLCQIPFFRKKSLSPAPTQGEGIT